MPKQTLRQAIKVFLLLLLIEMKQLLLTKKKTKWASVPQIQQQSLFKILKSLPLIYLAKKIMVLN